MTQIIDRRLNGKNKSAINRQRFIQRFKKQIKEAVANAINRRSITDINKGERITIPRKDISEPVFHNGQGGKKQIIFPGNKNFVSGDHLKRPVNPEGEGGDGASNEGSGNDDFSFEITKEEFLNLFFEDMELPDLIKTTLQEIKNYTYLRGGFTTAGSPTNINIIRSFKNALGRRLIFRTPAKRRLDEAEEELADLLKDKPEDDIIVLELKKEISALEKKIAAIPFIDDFDIRYNNKIKLPKPSACAVMFCIMDVSGSMDEMKKEIAKRFFILLYLFLTKTYEHIELVFIRHHTTAKEVDEHEFFYSRETGGTVVSSALELMKNIIQERYRGGEWNLYGAQASDGDNWNADSPLCEEILMKDIMPFMQYFSYVEIMPRHHQSLWRSYLVVKELYPQFAMKSIFSAKEIYPVFHDLFKRRVS